METLVSSMHKTLSVQELKEGTSQFHAPSLCLGLRKRFCKGNCEEGNILVETTDDTAQRGRYSLVYKRMNIFSDDIMYVSITKLTTSDAGRYGCGLVRTFSFSSYQGFEIRVDAVTSAKPTPAPSASTLTTTQSLSSTSSSASTLTTTQSLSSTSSSSSSGASKQTQQQQTTSAGPGVVLYMSLTLVVIFIVLSVALLIFCWKRASKPEEPPEETEYEVFVEADQVYEEIRSIEMSTVYSHIEHIKPNGVETTDEYSLATAATSQENTEDSSIVTYSEVSLSNRTATSLHSAPCGDADYIVYSVPRVGASSDVSPAEDASPPLYSTVTSHEL
ncbi:A-agglutinin anchorage subunit-like isoform X1 [Cottoperca gobio]|uniref:A-agglutinin anchorage subunit-like isoform X1 n=1 Tax=Cottoperca gobio TaxID=56716 RepID=A0A6J2Q0N3_COTGO|nr:A-agglutinin anchorage subunit-like isoform X1 [Cottoperca gobio]XP_029292049.1 A-agglutinin anchorage subunit-like isoform X1 [Cottoperca gobio]